MFKTSPHRTLMLLHRLVDQALVQLLAPMRLEHVTEGYVTVDFAELEGLVSAHSDPQAVLAGFGALASQNGVLIAEPALCSTILSRIWRNDRDKNAPLTQVEGEILRQFMARLVGTWATAWQDDGVKLLPEFSLAGSLSTITPQLSSGRWHIARTVVRDQDTEKAAGVFLFAYPEQLMPRLTNEARSIMWRTRVERGLTEHENNKLQAQLAGPLRELAITAPLQIRQHMTLGALDSLERGDIIALDTDAHGLISFDVLGREVLGQLARCGENLAVSLAGSAEELSAAQEQANLAAQQQGNLAAPQPANTAAPEHAYGENAYGENANSFDTPPEPDPLDWNQQELVS